MLAHNYSQNISMSARSKDPKVLFWFLVLKRRSSELLIAPQTPEWASVKGHAWIPVFPASIFHKQIPKPRLSQSQQATAQTILPLNVVDSSKNTEKWKR
jgi:hypothetical protein